MLFRSAGDVQVASVLVHDLSANCQAEAKAAVFIAGVLRREICRGKPLKVFAADTFALVDDLHADPLPPGLGGGEVLQLNADGRADGRCIDRVGQDIAKAALHEHGIHLDNGGGAVRAFPCGLGDVSVSAPPTQRPCG